MNDLITAATSGLFVEVGKIIEHMKAQQERIADLERQLIEYKQAMFDAGRIAAEASAPAVEQQPVAYGAFYFGGNRAGKLYAHCETQAQINDYIAQVHQSNDSITLCSKPLYAAPQAADTDKVRKALHEAVAAIYFDDNSKYEGTLWNIVRHLSPSIIELLQSDPHAAYCAVSERKCPCGFDKSGCDHYNREGDCTHKPDANMAAQAPVREVPGWQPIETAPKDGREVLLQVELRAGVRGKQLVGHWMPGGHCIEDHPPIAAGWYFWNGRSFDMAAKPLFWMPLPAAPVQQEREKP